MNGANFENKKIFVGGLSWETDKETLKAHFEQYGEVTDSVVMSDPQTKKPRGFGFVTFKDQNALNRALQPVNVHIISNKRVDPKRATDKNSEVPINDRANKIFVGGIDVNTTEEDLTAFFSQFGKVHGAELKMDKATNRTRGFAFVAFQDEVVVEKVCKMQYHVINRKTVECKKALPRAATQQKGEGGGVFVGSYGYQQPGAGGGYEGRYMTPYQGNTGAGFVGGYGQQGYQQAPQPQAHHQQPQAPPSQHQQQQQAYYGYYATNPAPAQYSGASPYAGGYGASGVPNVGGYGGSGVPNTGGYGGGVPTSQQQVVPGVQNQQMVGASYGQQRDQSTGYPANVAGYTADAYAGQQPGYNYGGGHAQPAATYQQPYGGNAQPGPQNAAYGQSIGRAPPY